MEHGKIEYIHFLCFKCTFFLSILLKKLFNLFKTVYLNQITSTTCIYFPKQSSFMTGRNICKFTPVQNFTWPVQLIHPHKVPNWPPIWGPSAQVTFFALPYETRRISRKVKLFALTHYYPGPFVCQSMDMKYLPKDLRADLQETVNVDAGRPGLLLVANLRVSLIDHSHRTRCPPNTLGPIDERQNQHNPWEGVGSELCVWQVSVKVGWCQGGYC